MHALNILWLLNEVDQNTKIDIRCVKTKSADWIEIKTSDFHFYINEYGSCSLQHLNQPKSAEKDIEYWEKVKTWVKKYYQESF